MIIYSLYEISIEKLWYMSQELSVTGNFFFLNLRKPNKLNILDTASQKYKSI